MYILAPSTYPYSQDHLRRDHPDTSFPSQMSDAMLAEWGVYPVTRVAPPDYNSITHRLIESQPVEVNGVWTQQWALEALSAEEAAANQADADTALYESVVAATQQRLDTFAQERGYDNILSACTYASSSVVKFSTEGQYCVDARDATWDALLTMLAEVQAGTRPRPSGYADIEADLPVLVWP
jgi:hypothetical protein